jgi:CRISPR/Cas system Type II protein with McrA/HNH and RuvC-like nuclease domain
MSQCIKCGKKTYKGDLCTKCKKEVYALYKEEKKYADFVIFNRDDFKCVYCGRSPIEDGVRLVIDHIEPYCIGQDNSLYNLITACDDCNIAKNVQKLPRGVYLRIVQRNIQRNGFISDKTKEKVERFINLYFIAQKERCPLHKVSPQ